MIRAGVVFGAGVAAGVYGMVKVRRVAEALTPDGMRDRIGAAVVGARMFRDVVAQGQADAEARLREHYRALGAAARPGRPHPQLTASTTMTAAPAALEDREGKQIR